MATPTITQTTQTYENESIECAKLIFTEPGSYKFAQIVSAETDYIFQFVCKAESATTLTIQVGDTVKTQAITTDLARYVIPFPNTTNDNTSLYITFPAGTYYLFNLQLERATTASAWRPAPEDAEDYADEASRKAVDAQTQEEIFNKLTNNGETQGLYLLDGKVYVNASYIQSGTLTGDFIRGGVISGTEINIGNGVFVVDDEGKVTAANINITGGTIKIDTEGGTAQNSIILRHTWAGVEKSVMISGDHIIYASGDSRIQILGDQVSITNGSGSNIKQTAILNNVSGLGGFKLYQNGVSQFEAYGSGRAVIFDSNGKRRSLWDSTGIKFYAADGTTITKQL